MLATFAFDVCHEVYCAAREVLDGKIATLNLESSGKYVWHPDRLPRLAEWVADFARAGERALAGAGAAEKHCLTRTERREIPRCAERQDARRSDVARNDNEKRARRDSEAAGGSGKAGTETANDTKRPSRLVMFRVFYLGGAEYAAARRHLGISEFTWADWSEEIRRRVGSELVRAGMFPPSKYFSFSASEPEAGKEDELCATGT